LFSPAVIRRRSTLLPRRDQAALDAELVHQAGEPEAVHQHADRADDARLPDVDAVGAHGDEIAARGANILDHRVQRHVGVLLAQPLHLVVDRLRLHRAAAGRVDAHHHALGILVLECGLQRGRDALGARVGAGRDQAVHLDHRGVLLAGGLAALPVHRHQQDQGDVAKGEQLEEDAP
jgi:hypothetical protein